MPLRPPTPCTHPGCGQLATPGNHSRCDNHPHQPWTRRRTNTGRNGSTRRERKLRARVLTEEPLCATGCGQPSQIDDHIVPLAEGGARLDRANHQGLCPDCHAIKTAAESHHRR